MSEIKVNSIKGVGASAAAITVNNSDGTCTANITNNLSNRRLTINGDMRIAQRGTSSTTSGINSVDRFALLYNGTDEAPTQAQVDIAAGTTPYTLGFRKAFKVTNGNQTSGAGSSDYVYYQHKIEAQDIANSGWNYTSSSSFITLSFWVKSSVAQNFYGYVRTHDFGTGSGAKMKYVYETGSLTANTWTKITKTISGNSALQIDNDVNNGFEITLAPFWGTTYTGSGISLNTWEAWDSALRQPDSTTTWYTTNDATFELTGVQLEVGSVATDFEHRSFAQELQLCKRYFQVPAGGGNFTGNTTYYRSGNIETQIKFEPEMRATPTFVATTGTNYYYFYRDNSFDNFNSWGSINAMGSKGGAINASTSSANNGIAGGMLLNGGVLTFSAEL